jgi:hypothetical protein
MTLPALLVYQPVHPAMAVAVQFSLLVAPLLVEARVAPPISLLGKVLLLVAH